MVRISHWKETLGAVCIVIVCLLASLWTWIVAMQTAQERPARVGRRSPAGGVPAGKEGFQSGGPAVLGRSVRTGTPLCLWSPRHVYLQGEGRVLRTSEALPRADATGDASPDRQWILESAADPVGSMASFPLPLPVWVRIRHVATGNYLRGTDTLDVVPYASSSPDSFEWQVIPEEGAGDLQYGQSVRFVPKSAPTTHLALADGGPLLEKGLPAPTSRFLVVDVLGNTDLEDLARRGRASSPTASLAYPAAMAIDGRQETYARCEPDPTTGAAHWELELSEPSLLQRIEAILPATGDVSTGLIFRVLDRHGVEVQRKGWNASASAPEGTPPLYRFVWEGLMAPGARLHVDTTQGGRLVLHSVRVFGSPMPPAPVAMDATWVDEGEVPWAQTTLIPEDEVRVAAQTGTYALGMWTKVSMTTATPLVLWSWGTETVTRSFEYQPRTRSFHWRLRSGGRIHVQRELRLEEADALALEEGLHVLVLERAPVLPAGGWYAVPQRAVVHPWERRVYRWPEGGGPVLPGFPTMATLPSGLAPQTGTVPLSLAWTQGPSLEVWVQGQRRAAWTFEGDRWPAPTGPLRLAGAESSPLATYRSVRLLAPEPSETQWMAMLQDYAQGLTKELPEGEHVFAWSALPRRLSGQGFVSAWVRCEPRLPSEGPVAVSGAEGTGVPALERWGDEAATAPDTPNRARFAWGALRWTMPLRVWVHMVWGHRAGKAYVWVQGRLVQAGRTADDPSGLLDPVPRTYHPLAVRADEGDRLWFLSERKNLMWRGRRWCNGPVPTEGEDAWALRGPHPDRASLSVLRDLWWESGCGHGIQKSLGWDMERDLEMAAPYLVRLAEQGPEVLRRVLEEQASRARRFLKHASPTGEEASDQAAAERCYAGVPLNVFEEQWQVVQARERALQVVLPKCLPSAAPTPSASVRVQCEAIQQKAEDSMR